MIITFKSFEQKKMDIQQNVEKVSWGGNTIANCSLSTFTFSISSLRSMYYFYNRKN